ncbi:MAG TPA: 16S rRNA (adenine(1518)-N(6)/adenine(1519)-N(6))-dimethyltransferase RsmA [Gammaproteobacteria bacterium]|nr:16S rRNA (adenine(1518)-N(6)/adenine(1519)-N(6))-dimethyltransferase RsmA [Gammaproteobacteria bacterium]
MTHHPKKHLGQHFLHDREVIAQLIAAIAPKPYEHLIEIGPGQGALTEALLPVVKAMDAIELDRDLILPLTAACKQLGKLTIHPMDVLKFDFSQLTTKEHSLRIVGNLPYQISTPLLFHLIQHISLIKDLHFMLQKEVVNRLAAPAGIKAYGRLSVMVQYHFTVEALFDVGPQAFYPPPAVNSAVVRLIPKIPSPIANNYQLFADIVREAFNHRRKTLHNCLRGFVTSEQLQSLGIDPNIRPERLAVAEFVRISNAITTQGAVE